MTPQNTLIFNPAWLPEIAQMSNEEAGKIFKVLAKFLENPKEEVLNISKASSSLAAFFEKMKKAIIEKYRYLCEVKRKRAEGGHLGGRPKKNAGENLKVSTQKIKKDFSPIYIYNNTSNNNTSNNNTSNNNTSNIEIEKKINKKSFGNFFQQVTSFFSSKPEPTGKTPEQILGLNASKEKKEKKVAAKKRKEPKAPKSVRTPEIPDLDTFVGYARETYQNELKIDFSPFSYALEAKYHTWKEAGWKDGYGKPIQNWRMKLRNTIPYLKPIYNGNSTPQRGAKPYHDTRISGITAAMDPRPTPEFTDDF